LVAGPPLPELLSGLLDAAPGAALGEAGSELPQGAAAPAAGLSLAVTPGIERAQPAVGGNFALAAGAEAEGGVVDLGIAPSAWHDRPADGALAVLDSSMSLRLSTDSGGSIAPQDVLLFGDHRVGVLGVLEGQNTPDGLRSDQAPRFPATVAPLEGGLIELGSLPAARRYRLSSQSLATVEASTALRTSASPATLNVASDFALVASARPSSLVFADGGVDAAGSTPDLPRTSKEITASNGGGSGPSSSGESGLAAERNLGSGVASRAGSTSASEGGFIDIAPDAETPSRSSEPWDTGDPARSGLGEEAESRDAARIAKDDDPQASKRSSGSDALEDATEGSGGSSKSPEGGMIELAAAFLPTDGSSRVSGPSSGAAGGDQFTGDKEIRMDNGVALFHAFELATAPNLQGDRPNSAWTEGSQSGPLETTAPPANPDSAAGAEAASAEKKPEGQPVQRAGVLQAIAVASFLAALDRVHQEERFAERRRRGQTGPNV